MVKSPLYYYLAKIEEDSSSWYEIHLFTVLSLWWSPLGLHFLINVTWSVTQGSSKHTLYSLLLFTPFQTHTLFSPPLHPLPNTHVCFSSISHLCHSCKTSQRYGWAPSTSWISSSTWRTLTSGESTMVFWKVDKFEQWWKGVILHCTPPPTSQWGMGIECVLGPTWMGAGWGRELTHPSFYFAIMWGPYNALQGFIQRRGG